MKLLMRLFVLCVIGCCTLPFAAAQKLNEYNYFSTRLANVSTQLHLSDDQQVKLKHILEQENALMNEVYRNIDLSRTQKLKKYWAIIGESDAKIKPMLAGDQVGLFEEMQKKQKQRYAELMQEAKSSSGK